MTTTKMATVSCSLPAAEADRASALAAMAGVSRNCYVRRLLAATRPGPQEDVSIAGRWTVTVHHPWATARKPVLLDGEFRAVTGDPPAVAVEEARALAVKWPELVKGTVLEAWLAAVTKAP